VVPQRAREAARGANVRGAGEGEGEGEGEMCTRASRIASLFHERL